MSTSGTRQETQEKTGRESAKPWKCGDPMENPLPGVEGDAWKSVYKHLAEPDLARCKAWREEVETLLIFAGLFSAVVTAFTVESYKSLREESDDKSAALLLRIALQLEGNTTTPKPLDSPFSPSPSSVRVNTLWFLSLVISLSTVLIGTVCLQWLREHLNLPSNPREAFALHHMHIDGLDKWYIPHMFTSLPLLLQISLILFFIGMVDFLWELHHLVAALVLAAVGMVLMFYIVTTTTPAIQYFSLRFPRSFPSHGPRSPCPYRSPQSLIFLRLTSPIATLLQNHIPSSRHWKPNWAVFPGWPDPRTSWMDLHKTWFWQRDFDIADSKKMPEISSFLGQRQRMSANAPQANVTLYDHIHPLRRALSLGQMAGSSPWICIEILLRDVEEFSQRGSFPWEADAGVHALRHLMVLHDEPTNPEVAPASAWSSAPLDLLRDFVMCGISRAPRNLPVYSYWLEKHFRVLNTLLESALTRADPFSGQRAMFYMESFLQQFLRTDLPDEFVPRLQDIIENFFSKAVGVKTPVGPEIACSSSKFSMLAASVIASHLRDHTSVRERHNSMVQHAVAAMKGNPNDFLVVMLSYYLFILMREMYQASDPLLESTVVAAKDLLILLREYRSRRLEHTSVGNVGRQILLTLQREAFPETLHFYSYMTQGPHLRDRPVSPLCQDYFIGMFDTDDDNRPLPVWVRHTYWQVPVGTFVRKNREPDPLPSGDILVLTQHQSTAVEPGNVGDTEPI